MKLNIKWENKYSLETGYVGKVSKAKGYFENADKEGAKSYASMKTVEKDLAILNEIGEADNNNFYVEEA
ncbi:MAG: hypothetical protein Q4D13_04730 [Erysipelotrichaceae bacterium]|nr:hypothetical protein [Erysipelotrichaceae bacterium]